MNNSSVKKLKKKNSVSKQVSRQPSITTIRVNNGSVNNSIQHSRKGSIAKKPKKVREEVIKEPVMQLSPNLSSTDGHLYMGGLDERLIESRIAENIR